jgi:hypothetical protein
MRLNWRARARARSHARGRWEVREGRVGGKSIKGEGQGAKHRRANPGERQSRDARVEVWVRKPAGRGGRGGVARGTR